MKKIVLECSVMLLLALTAVSVANIGPITQAVETYRLSFRNDEMRAEFLEMKARVDERQRLLDSQVVAEN